MQKIPPHIRRIGGRLCLLSLAVTLLLALSSCGTWNWMWERQTLGHPDIETEADGTTIVFDGAVEFDPDRRHGGTDIYYIGASDSENRNRIVVIDPGHQLHGNSELEPNGPGSDDMKAKVSPGTIGCATGQTEYELNLDVAIRLRNLLVERGYSVVMIRETNEVDVSNRERSEIANKYNQYGTAILVRIHANSWTDDRRGAMTLCMAPNNPYPDCAAQYTASRLLSELILDHYCESTEFSAFPIREVNDMTGINWCSLPVTIVEMGFLSNADEDRAMLEPLTRTRAATGIANGVDAYFARVDELIPPTTETETVAEAMDEDMTDPVTDVPLDTQPPPATEPVTEPETDPATEPETTILFENPVPYDKDTVHAGTDIYYAGDPASENRNRIVVIDPGHQLHGSSALEPNGPGSTDMKAEVSAGATGVATGQTEYELNLAVALLLRDELIARGYSVVMIRETNEVDVSNMERSEIANKYNQYGTAILVRIHANSWTDDRRGAMTLCQAANNPYPDCAAQYAASRRLSDILLAEYCAATAIESLSVREVNNMTGINWCTLPVTIVEMGFLSNPEEDALLADPATQRAAAIGLSNGVDAYFGG